jgi:hypothetical protein
MSTNQTPQSIKANSQGRAGFQNQPFSNQGTAQGIPTDISVIVNAFSGPVASEGNHAFAVSQLSDNAFQTMTLQMPDGSTGTLNLYYRASTPRWFFDLLHPALPNGGPQGNGLVTFPNLLRPWKNIVPFGFACVTLDGQDPVGNEDFIDGYATLYVIDATGILMVEAQVFNNVLAQAALAAVGAS